MINETHRDSDKFMLRLPTGMRDRIKSVAESNGRSMNAEIVAALDEKYPAPVADEVTDPGAKFLWDLAAKIRARNPKPGSLRAIQADTYDRLAYDLHIRMRSKAEGDGVE